MKPSLSLWCLPAIPLIAKLLIAWNGSDHPGNSWWIFFCRMEILAGVVSLISVGIWIGWQFGCADHDAFLKMKQEHCAQLNSYFHKFQSEHVPLREQLAGLKSDLKHEQWKYQQLQSLLDEEKKKVTRTPEQANAEALKKVVA